MIECPGAIIENLIAPCGTGLSTEHIMIVLSFGISGYSANTDAHALRGRYEVGQYFWHMGHSFWLCTNWILDTGLGIFL